MHRSGQRTFYRFSCAVVLAALAACMPSQRVGAPGQVRGPGGLLSGQGPDLTRVYESMGLIAGVGQMPFVGNIAFLSGPSPDTTLVLVAVSLPARILNFGRDGDRYSASYTVRLELRQGTNVVQQSESKESVRVPTYKETTRTDEAVIWQQYLRVAPGEYTLNVGVRDENTIRNTTEDVAVSVPRLSAGSLSTPLPVYEAITRNRSDSLPRLLARPRATVTFGGDSLMGMYMESAGLTGPTKVAVMIIGDANLVVWRDTLTLDPRGGTVASTIFGVPVTQMGIGVVTLLVTRPGTADTTRARLFVSLGDDLPIGSFDEMLRYLKYFATAERVRQLRDAPPAARPQAWLEFLRVTDPIPSTTENEGLREYFNRIRLANTRFKDDGPVGWQSDRGVAFVGLGEPDNILDSGNMDPDRRGRQQVWVYQNLLRLQLVFVDNSGVGRWRLSTQHMGDLEAAIRRKLAAEAKSQ